MTLNNSVLSISVIAMATDVNSNGDIFGGWLLSQMDLAGTIACKNNDPGKYVTIAIDKMKFKKHVSIGDLVKIYTSIVSIGNSSIVIKIQAFVDRMDGKSQTVEVTEGMFTYVKINDERKPITIQL